MAQLCGGWTPMVQLAGSEVQELCNSVREHVETQAGRKFLEYIAIEYISQVVAGTNYTIKVHLGNEEYMHISVFQPLPCYGGNPEVHGFQLGKAKTDSLK